MTSKFTKRTEQEERWKEDIGGGSPVPGAGVEILKHFCFLLVKLIDYLFYIGGPL